MYDLWRGEVEKKDDHGFARVKLLWDFHNGNLIRETTVYIRIPDDFKEGEKVKLLIERDTNE